MQVNQIISLTLAATIGPRLLVKSSASNTVALCTAAGDRPIGVTEFGGSSGKAVGVIISGVCKIRTGAAIANLALPLCSDASGRVVSAAPAAGTNNGVIGYPLETASAADVEIDVLLTQFVFQG